MRARHSFNRLRPVARHLLRLRGPLRLERELRLAQPCAALGRGAEPLGQLVAALLAVELILGGVDLAGLLEDLLRDLAVAAVLVVRRRRRDLRPIDRDNADLHQAGLRAQPQHPGEQVR